MRKFNVKAAITAAAILSASPAFAATCGNGPGGFNAWVDGFRGRAASAGISKATIASGLSGLYYDRKIIRLDRNQKSFKLSFNQFYRRRVGGGLIARGRSHMARHKSTLDQIESRYGVDREVLIAIWGLETNFGADGAGGLSIPNSLATLSYDCRRSAFFEKELIATLKIIDRGHLSKAQLRGGWAGEIGPMQFLPSIMIANGVDFDGNGRINLVSSTADMLASAAAFLKSEGWKAGGGWGPGSSNYGAIQAWNRATVYQKTIAKMADQLKR